MKKSFIIFILLTVTYFLFSQDVFLLKEFNINGKKELKKVKIKGQSEFTYSGKIKMNSTAGDARELYFYDENDLLIKKLSARYVWNSDNTIYSYEYNLEKNVFELNIKDFYETLYFYNEKNQLIREAVTDADNFCNYSYDERGNIIQIEDNWGTCKREYNSKNQLVHEIYSDRSDIFYEYDDKNREVYSKQITKRGAIYEDFSQFDDEKHTKKRRRVNTYKGKLTYDVNEYFEYDSEGYPVYAKWYKCLQTAGEELINAEIAELWFEYDEKGFLIHSREIFREQETNIYYEYAFWDNGNVNTSFSYVEE